MRTLALLLLLAAPASAKKQDDFAPLKGLIGTWRVDRDCRVIKDTLIVEIVRLPNALRATYFNSLNVKRSVGKSEIFYNAEAERYRVFTYIPELVKLIGSAPIPGTLSVAGEDEEEPGLINATAKLSLITGSAQVRLRDKDTKATFTMKAQSPLGPLNCTGVGLKQPPKK
ncbi:MAG: hypothetical protein M0D55_18805 [Elusimicrobiota bacterium]|nr:MAG: hypothetical protein M0D55_18805 [Elusimicrobiota bacterium]